MKLHKEILFDVIFEAPLGDHLVEELHESNSCEGCFFKLENDPEGWGCAKNKHESVTAGTAGRFDCDHTIYKLKKNFKEIHDSWAVPYHSNIGDDK